MRGHIVPVDVLVQPDLPYLQHVSLLGISGDEDMQNLLLRCSNNVQTLTIRVTANSDAHVFRYWLWWLPRTLATIKTPCLIPERSVCKRN